VDQLLNNPVYHALLSGDAHLGSGTSAVKYFDEQVSPFAGFPEDHDKGFDELYNMVPADRRILYATRKQIKEPAGWQLKHEIKGLQFVFTGQPIATDYSLKLVPLETKHVEEMMALAKLTKPGPFDKRTIDFGHYYGIFDNDKLVAMTGQRLHVYNYTEVSAVCTHPDCLGKGFAAVLIQHQLNLICKSGQHPFLHVRGNNERAIALYERLGFIQNGPMNFYFLKRKQFP
jgi:ribosomal protein S18 acetylase RimI-like enzyme